MRGKSNPEMKARCLRLRMKKHLSLSQISIITGVSKGTLCGWLRGHVLPKHVTISLSSRTGISHRGMRKDRGAESSLHKMIVNKLSRNQIGRISEAAVLLRLVIAGCNPFLSPFDGEKADWLAETPNGNIVKIQVKACKRGRSGLPFISLTCSDGKRYMDGDFDFIIGYDLFTDVAYVWSWSELLQNRSRVTITKDAAERWGKVLVASK